MAILTILMVDDDDDDYALLKSAFDLVTAIELQHVKDGRLAIDHLEALHAPGSKLPDAIILDINMPRLDGVETLKWIRSMPMLSSVPVVIHSTTSENEFKLKCLALGASAFSCKGTSFEEMTMFARNVIWLVLGQAAFAHK